jgi:hypothetical protein
MCARGLVSYGLARWYRNPHALPVRNEDKKTTFACEAAPQNIMPLDQMLFAAEGSFRGSVSKTVDAVFVPC